MPAVRQRNASSPAPTTTNPAAAAPPKKGGKPPKGGKGKGKGKAKDTAEDGAVLSEWATLEAQITKERGEGVVFDAADLPAACHIPTGAFILDFALLGGIAEGHGCMYLGKESGGKTTMAMRAVAEFQRKHPDQLAVWVDTESMFDRDWAKVQGVDLKRCKMVQPATGEEAVDLIAAAMGALEVGMVVLDSIPGCVPKTVQDRSAEDKTRAALAALMGILCSKVLLSWSAERKRKHRVTFLPINQYRSGMDMYGPAITEPGGRQIKHLPSTRVDFKNKPEKAEDNFGNEVIDYNDHSFQLLKWKHGCSIQQGMFQMVINPDKDEDMPQGTFDDFQTVVTFAKRFNLLMGGGGKYRIPLILGEQAFPTYDAIKLHLKQNKHDMRMLCGSLIAMQRYAKNLTPLPPDKYLVAPGIGAKLPLAELMAIIDGGAAGVA